MANASPYVEITRQISQVQQNLREYRLRVVLTLLVKETVKPMHVQALEAKLTRELSKQLQCSFAIDDLLDEIEAFLLP